VFKDTEVVALQATITELEERLVQVRGCVGTGRCYTASSRSRFL
jgi:hypothetical protein